MRTNNCNEVKVTQKERMVTSVRKPAVYSQCIYFVSIESFHCLVVILTAAAFTDVQNR